MVFGLGKKESAQTSQPANLPIDEILRLRQQGLNNNQIVQALQRNGYKLHQVFDAMNQADLKSAAPQPPPLMDEPQLEPAPQSVTDAEESYSDERIEEVAEAIIEEKWNSIVKEINKIIDWKNKLEARIEAIEKREEEIKKDFESLHQGVSDKVSSYDKSISEVGSDVKAIESIFKKILPTLTSNVNELSRITKSLRKSK